jgi:polysaccharide deacetylase 2 family uncharacterized protein YibQ
VTDIPIHKIAGRKCPNNYRGMSLTNSSHKIYRKILNEKLKTYSETFLDDTLSALRKR